MSKQQKQRFVSPAGRAIYPKLNKPDTKFNAEGVYEVKLAVSDEKFTTFLEEQHNKAVEAAKAENKGKKIREADLPFTVDEDSGEAVVKFKCKAKVQSKSGEVFEQKPAIFDAKGKSLTKAPNIGGGSILKVSYEIVPFYTAIAGAGISLRLKAVQLIGLVEFGGGGAGAYGFGAEDGYEADDGDEVENDFEADESEVSDDSFDF